jgi:hypothetical protein
VNRLCPALLWLSTIACAPVPAALPTPTPDPGENSVSASQPPRSNSSLPDDYAFAFVTLGGKHEGGFYEWLDKGGPAMLAALWGEDEVPEAIAAKVDEAFGAAQQRWDRAGELGTDSGVVGLALEPMLALGYAPPDQPLWLIGADGPCRTEYAAPSLGWYSWGLETIELSWGLTGCDPGATSTQIAVLADSLPDDLRYVRSEQRSAGRFDPTTSPYAELVRSAIFHGSPTAPDEVWLREVVVPGTTLVELTIALVRRDPGEPGRPPEPCFDEQRNLVIVGLMESGEFSRFELRTQTGDVDSAELRGAFVLGSEVVWTVHESWGQAVVNAPLRSPPAVEIEVASFHPEDFGEIAFAQVEYCGP